MTDNNEVLALISAMTDYLEQEIDPELDVIEQWRDRLEAALAAQQPVGEVVVTKNDAGQIVAVTRQDAEHRILSVIATSATAQDVDLGQFRALAAALREAPEGFVMVPVEVVDLCWNVIDNLSDPPINDDWAKRTADRLIQLLDAEVKDGA